jgi:hypothetical protein
VSASVHGLELEHILWTRNWTNRQFCYGYVRVHLCQFFHIANLSFLCDCISLLFLVFHPHVFFLRVKVKLSFCLCKGKVPDRLCGQSSWLHNGDVLWFLWGTNWIYICYVEHNCCLRTSHHFKQPEFSIPCSQELSNGRYPVPDQFSPYHPILYLWDPFTSLFRKMVYLRNSFRAFAVTV